MGMVYESEGSVAMASKPKERQFQVVPMPGVFNRGRWKCWDYKDSADTPAFNPEERDILEFDARVERTDNLFPNANAAQEEPIFLTPPREACEHPATSTIMVTSMALHESSPHVSHAPSGVSSLTLESVPTAFSSIPPNISVGSSSDFHRPGTIPPMQSPSLPATVHTAISSLTGPSYGTSMTMFDSPSTASMTGSSQMGGPSVVAIDNKIEQAMDLVKTHLTYAVREEVEVLRSSIVELEAKVVRLENENSLLRQVAPAEIVAQLPYLVAAAQQQQQNQSIAPQQQQNVNPAQPSSQAGGNISEQ